MMSEIRKIQNPYADDDSFGRGAAGAVSRRVGVRVRS